MRAHPLLQGQGNARLIVCPYHQWCYQSDGRFRGARGKEVLKDWISESADLKPVLLEKYASLIFVNLDTEAAPLADQAEELLADMHTVNPDVEKLRRVKRIERQVAANWKTIVDNNHNLRR